MRGTPITRRELLGALGGAAIALPRLELTARAAASAPQRYLVLFAGISAGRPEEGAHLLQPATYGPGYPLSPGLQPLQKRGVASLVSVVSGLRMPRSPSQPGGMSVTWHTTSVGPLLSGAAFVAPGGNNNSPRPNGPTSDQVVAASPAFAGKTPLASINYRVQATTFGSNPERGIVSWRKTNGVMQANAPTVNAQQAWQSLVTGLRPTDPAQLEQLGRDLAGRRSAVDLAVGKSALLARLGTSDRQRLERHFDELRALEKRLEASPDTLRACARPAEPRDTTAIQDNYTNEQERWPILCELIRTAFVCDLSRVATLCVTCAQSFLNVKNLIPSQANTDVHNTTHASLYRSTFKEVMAWHVDIFAHLVEAFRKTPDADGRSLLDNTALIYAFEGGRGYDPQEGHAASSHSSENMSVLLAGRAAGRAPGQHINGNGKHPASVLLTAMNNVGVAQSKLGDIDAMIDEIKT